MRAPDDAHPPRFRSIPKHGGVRWLTDLDEADDAAYRAAVAPLVGSIERSLGPEVVANRTRSGSRGWRLAAWTRARAVWERRLSSALATAPPPTAFAVADVRSCYPAISPATVLRTLGPAGAPAARLLERFADAGVRGLPVGPDPSAVLANAVLAPLDEALRRAGVAHVRWVDDLVVWGERADVVRALAGAHRAASALGLELHAAKTGIVEDRAAIGRASCGRSWASREAAARVDGPSGPIIAAP